MRSLFINGSLYSVLFLTALPQFAQNTRSPQKNPTVSDEEATAAKDSVSSAEAELPEIEISAEAPRSAASSRLVRRKDLQRRIISKPADLAQLTPGLFAVNHAGGGKANQYFLRGFDIDHGTDLLLRVDGMPVNMVSHGHGQGYADLHFIIPEVIEDIDTRKGPYFADCGDFATAGSMEFSSASRTPESQVAVSGGKFGTGRALWVSNLQHADSVSLIAAEGSQTDGPFVNPEKWKRGNLFFRHTRGTERENIAFQAMAYSGSWNASGQIPERAVLSGLIDRFGSLDDSEGGSSQRFSLSGHWKSKEKAEDFSADVYLIRQDFSLFSNFTFYKDDPVNGDQIAQSDRRLIGGGNARQRRSYEFFSLPASTTFGAEFRTDLIENRLSRSVRRELIEPKTSSEITQTDIAGWLEQEIIALPWLKLIAGARAEQLVFQVNDRLENQGSSGAPATADGEASSGQASDAVILPKGTIIISPVREWEIYLNSGVGFHSNDARGAVIRGSSTRATVTPLTRAYGYEAGIRLTLWRRFETAFALWQLDMDSEIVWVGDEGTTEAGGRSRRRGGDFELRVEIFPWLFLDADLTVNEALFRDNAGNANAVALAPQFTAAGGLTVQSFSGINGSIRARHIAARPANETRTLTAEGFTVLDLMMSYRFRQLEFFVSVKNLTDTAWKEVQFATESRLKNEAAPVTEIHFVAGSPLAAEGGCRYYF